MKHIKIVNTIDDAKNLVAKSLIYDNIHKTKINWLKQPDQGEVFSINEGTDGNLMPDMFKISITYHNIDSSLTYDLGFGDALDILKVALNGREIDKSTLTSLVFDNDGDNILDVYINKDPNNESVDIHWSNVSPEIDPVTVHINKYIGNIPFLSYNIKEVICDAPIIKIRDSIFGSTNIESFEYDGVIEYIGNNGFMSCKNLKSIELKDGLQYIGNSAFDSSGLTGELTLPNSIKSIGNNAFGCCSGLKSVTIYNGDILESGVFSDCTNIENIIIYNMKIYISSIFNSTNIKSVTLYNTEIINSGAFSGCTSLTQITLPNNLTIIRSGAFAGCIGLTELTLPNSITIIDSGAFSGCSGLTGELTLPNSLKSIGYSSFEGCTNATIYVPETIETINNGAFNGVKKVILKNYTRFDNWQTWGATEIVEK